MFGWIDGFFSSSSSIDRYESQLVKSYFYLSRPSHAKKRDCFASVYSSSSNFATFQYLRLIFTFEFLILYIRDYEDL